MHEPHRHDHSPLPSLQHSTRASSSAVDSLPLYAGPAKSAARGRRPSATSPHRVATTCRWPMMFSNISSPPAARPRGSPGGPRGGESLGDRGRGVGAGQAPGPLPHVRQARGVVEQVRHGGQQGGPVGRLFPEKEGGPCLAEHPCVSQLVSPAARRGQGHEDGRPAQHGELGQGVRPRPAHDEVCRGQQVGHLVGDEARREVVRAESGRIVALAHLVRHEGAPRAAAAGTRRPVRSGRTSPGCPRSPAPAACPARSRRMPGRAPGRRRRAPRARGFP